jgi:tryptophanyl-tRNA synthetase
MVTPLSWLERVPTYKEAFENVKDKDLHTYGFLGYPCLQTADIVIYSEQAVPLFVPVGEDQVSHVELSREIVRSFNGHFCLVVSEALWDGAAADDYRALQEIFGTAPGLRDESFATNVQRFFKLRAREMGIENFLEKTGKYSKHFSRPSALSEPGVMLTKTPRIPGLDGRKMSKSYGNAITLSESDDDIRKKTKVMVTDPARKRRSDPGNPDVCPVYDWHKLFSTPDTLQWAAEGCRTAGIGCIECKAKMADHLITWIAPVRERRLQYEKHPARVLEVIDDGSQRARRVAQQTIGRVREAVFGWEKKRTEIRNSTTEIHDTHD